MSHEITGIDKQQGLRQAWHKLTEVLSEIRLPESWLAKWNVVKSPLFSANGEKTEYCELVCTDDPKIRIGKPVHCESYGLIDNVCFLNTVQNAIDLIPGAVVESVGSVCGRGKIFVGVSVPQIREVEAAGRKILPCLNFLSSHDLSTEFNALANTFWPVCYNTYLSCIRTADDKILKVRIRHTKNAVDRLENVPALIDAYCGTVARFQAILDTMANESVNASQAERFFAGFLSAKDESEERKILANRPKIEISTRAENQRNRLVELFASGAGNRGSDRSDLFGAVTDYYSHESSGGSDAWKQVASSEFGSGQTNKARAFDILSNSERFSRVVSVGDLVLTAN